ncbi:MAG: LPS export ABC transporter permease LptG [Neisseria sp.]|nr:LPS export ABC transporter permease LptG [Neisseria sp.]
MKLLTRYLIKELSVMSLYALLALLALYSFFDIISEISDIGIGSYTSSTMLQYIALQMPAHAYELMPLAVLIGGLLALSRLSSSSELTVIKSSGISTRKLIATLLGFGLLFAVGTIVLGEWLAPASTRYAQNMKTLAQNGTVSTGADGLWLREQHSFINIREMLPDQSLRGITAYRHNDDFKLAETWSAESATQSADGTWQLQNVQRSILQADKVAVSQQNSEIWQANFDRRLLDVLLVRPEQMSISSLTAYISHLENNKQQTDSYRIAWWNKLMYPIATVVMALVALAFTPQSSRHTNMGLKLFGGICLGLAFHFAGRLFGFSGRLYGFPAPLAAMLPTLIFALWAIVLIYRQEKR